jgi:hypothetical protein
MDGVADVEELQGSQCRRSEGQQAQVHKPAGPSPPPGRWSRRTSGRRTGRPAPRGIVAARDRGDQLIVVHNFSIAFRPQQVRSAQQNDGNTQFNSEQPIAAPTSTARPADTSFT